MYFRAGALVLSFIFKLIFTEDIAKRLFRARQFQAALRGGSGALLMGECSVRKSLYRYRTSTLNELFVFNLLVPFPKSATNTEG